jgi:hypothetical protein
MSNFRVLFIRTVILTHTKWSGNNRTLSEALRNWFSVAEHDDFTFPEPPQDKIVPVCCMEPLSKLICTNKCFIIFKFTLILCSLKELTYSARADTHRVNAVISQIFQRLDLLSFTMDDLKINKILNDLLDIFKQPKAIIGCYYNNSKCV